jgi:hypothetical protein
MCDKKHSNALIGNYRTLTLEEKKNIQFSEVFIQADCGCFLRVKINGQVKTWKRNINKVQIPYKYGMYEYGYITENDEVRIATS